MKKKKNNLKLIENNVEKDDIILPETHYDRSYSSYNSGDNFSFTEEKEFKINPVASRFAFDLFKEEDAEVVAPIVRIKRVGANSKSEKWKIFEDNKNVFTIDSEKISKKERDFLASAEGFQFLLSESKKKNFTINGIKKEMKPRLKK